MPAVGAAAPPNYPVTVFSRIVQGCLHVLFRVELIPVVMVLGNGVGSQTSWSMADCFAKKQISVDSVRHKESPYEVQMVALLGDEVVANFEHKNGGGGRPRPVGPSWVNV